MSEKAQREAIVGQDTLPEKKTKNGLELEFMRWCRERGLAFTIPERDPQTPVNLDFYLPRYRLYVELKSFNCERLPAQLGKLSYNQDAMVLVGIGSVKRFIELVSDTGGAR
jgi:hypothetical protein